MNVNAFLNKRIGLFIAGFIIILMVSPVCIYGQSENSAPSIEEVKADTLLNRGEFEAAIATYNKLIKKKNGSLQILYKRAYAYFNMGKYNEALQDVNVYIASSGDTQGNLLRAYIYEQTSNFTEELKDINTLIEHVENPELLQWRASVAMEAGQYDIAQRDVQKLLKGQRSTQLLSFLGLTYYYQDKADSALIIFNQVIKEAPQQVETYLYAAALCLEESQYDLSLQYAEQGLTYEPQNATLLFYKGAALVEKEDFTSGCRCLYRSFVNGMDDAIDYLKEYCYGVE